MKKTIHCLTLGFMLLALTAQASFPVEKETKAKTELQQNTNQNAEDLKIIQQNDIEAATSNQAMADAEELLSPMSDQEMWITLALWFFLGVFAAHRWYRGKPTGWNILYILTGGGCGIWAIVDLVNILTKKF